MLFHEASTNLAQVAVIFTRSAAVFLMGFQGIHRDISCL